LARNRIPHPKAASDIAERQGGDFWAKRTFILAGKEEFQRLIKSTPVIQVISRMWVNGFFIGY